MNFKKATIGFFFAILIIMPFLSFLLPRESFSELENRVLAEAPEFSVNDLLDKSFMKDTESYMADHMLFRDVFTKMKTRLELLSGKSEIGGVYIGPDMLLEKLENPDPVITKQNLTAINSFAEKYKERLQTKVMLIPSALAFYPEQAPALAFHFDQAAYIQECYHTLDQTANIDIYTPLSARKGNDIFYRTDHHWTSYGAYTGYSALGKSLGFKANTMDMFNVRHASYDFLGTLYSKALYGEKLADRIDLYTPTSGDLDIEVIRYTEKNTQSYYSVFFEEYLSQKDQYSVFMGTNEAVVRIKTNVGNGQKLILFKDSYSHALMQFLPLHYEEILLVDLRYLNRDLNEYANLSDYQQALFIYSVAGFIKDSTVKKILAY